MRDLANRIARALCRLRDDEGGQALAEYAVLMVFIILGLAAVSKGFPAAIGHYYRGIVWIMCLPIP